MGVQRPEFERWAERAETRAGPPPRPVERPDGPLPQTQASRTQVSKTQAPTTQAPTTQEILRHLEEDGWVWVKSSGSHRQYRHATRAGRITISVHGAAEDVGPRLWSSVAGRAGLGPGAA